MSTATLARPRSVHLQEKVNAPVGRVDKENGVIYNVRILGFESSNGRTYSKAAMEKAKRLYENCPVNVNHQPQSRGNPGGDRAVQDRFGRLTGVHLAEDGLRGNLEYIRSHPSAAAIIEMVERMPHTIGLSHDAQGVTGNCGGRAIVEEITSVRSVDLVCSPATNASLFESRGHRDKLTPAEFASLLNSPRRLLEGPDPSIDSFSPEGAADLDDAPKPEGLSHAELSGILTDPKLDDAGKVVAIRTLLDKNAADVTAADSSDVDATESRRGPFGNLREARSAFSPSRIRTPKDSKSFAALCGGR